MKKIISLIAICLFFSCTISAQMFKDLGKKMGKTVEKKVEEKTAEETEKAMDEVFEETLDNAPSSDSDTGSKTTTQENSSTSELGLSTSTPASSYTFDYKIEMQVTSNNEVVNLNYYLPKTGNYLCTEINDQKIQEGLLMVYDLDREAMYTYMDNNGQKMKMGIDITSGNTNATEENTPDFVIEATGNRKSILGYQCQEYTMKGEDLTAKYWITKEVDLSFPSNFYNTKEKKNNSQEWINEIDGWVMEMEMTDTSNKKPQTVIMKCLSIADSNLNINSNEYKSINY